MATSPKRKRFSPAFSITPAMASGLMRIEAVKQEILTLPITPRVLAHLRETARLFSAHYSTAIEGNAARSPRKLFKTLVPGAGLEPALPLREKGF